MEKEAAQKIPNSPSNDLTDQKFEPVSSHCLGEIKHAAGVQHTNSKVGASSQRELVPGQKRWSSERQSRLRTAQGSLPQAQQLGLGTKAAETAKDPEHL